VLLVSGSNPKDMSPGTALGSMEPLCTAGHLQTNTCPTAFAYIFPHCVSGSDSLLNSGLQVGTSAIGTEDPAKWWMPAARAASACAEDFDRSRVSSHDCWDTIRTQLHDICCCQLSKTCCAYAV
jgi:hypothetical protein